MDDLIKIAANGQWTLEKGKTIGSMSAAERSKMIADFQTKQSVKSTPAATKAPATPMTSMPQGMKPAVHATGSPAMDKDKLAAIRAGIDRANAASPGAIKPAKEIAAPPTHGDKVQTKLDSAQAEADAKGKAKSGHKEAFAAGVALLAQHGNKGYQALQEVLAQRKMLDQAHETGKMPVKPKRELQGPIEMTQDAKGNKVTQPRQGTFHNEGATTRGQVVSRPVVYEDKATGEKRQRMITQEEKHQWAWDHNKKKWNHVKTTYGNSGT